MLNDGQTTRTGLFNVQVEPGWTIIYFDVERETERQRDGETERVTDVQTGETERQRDGETERVTDGRRGETGRQGGKKTERLIDTDTDSQRD